MRHTVPAKTLSEWKDTIRTIVSTDHGWNTRGGPSSAAEAVRLAYAGLKPSQGSRDLEQERQRMDFLRALYLLFEEMMGQKGRVVKGWPTPAVAQLLAVVAAMRDDWNPGTRAWIEGRLIGSIEQRENGPAESGDKEFVFRALQCLLEFKAGVSASFWRDRYEYWGDYLAVPVIEGLSHANPRAFFDWLADAEWTETLRAALAAHWPLIAERIGQDKVRCELVRIAHLLSENAQADLAHLARTSA
jgi:hypothetical protein